MDAESSASVRHPSGVMFYPWWWLIVKTFRLIPPLELSERFLAFFSPGYG